MVQSRAGSNAFFLHMIALERQNREPVYRPSRAFRIEGNRAIRSGNRTQPCEEMVVELLDEIGSLLIRPVNPMLEFHALDGIQPGPADFVLQMPLDTVDPTFFEEQGFKRERRKGGRHGLVDGIDAVVQCDALVEQPIPAGNFRD